MDGSVSSRMRPKARAELARERVRIQNDYGVDRWGSAFCDRPMTQIHTTARSHKRHAEARRMLSSSQYGMHHGDKMLRSQGFDVPPPAQRLAPFDRPGENCTVSPNATRGPSVPTAVHQPISPETRLAMGTPQVATLSGRGSPQRSARRPATSIRTPTVPEFVRRELAGAEFQPSWYSTAVTLKLERGKTDVALPKNAATDLRYHPVRAQGQQPETGRYPKDLKADGFRCFMTNERNSALTVNFSKGLRHIPRR